MNQCGQCSTPVEDVGTRLITCANCNNVYHSKEIGCSSVVSDSWYKKAPAAKNTWKCHKCGGLKLDIKRKNDDMTDGDGNAGTKTPRTTTPHDELFLKLSAMMDEKLTHHLGSIKTAINDLTSKVTAQATQLKTVTDRVTNIENEGVKCNCTEEVTELKKHADYLENNSWQYAEDLEALKNYTRKDNVVITGIPYTENEDSYEVAIKAAGAVGLQISRKDIVDCHRLPAAKRGSSAPTFIIKFVNRENKRQLIDGYRRTRPTADFFDGGDKNTKVYANEHLAPYTANLLRSARCLLSVGYAQVACRNGIVFVKKNATSEKIRIVSEAQVGNLKRAENPNK